MGMEILKYEKTHSIPWMQERPFIRLLALLFHLALILIGSFFLFDLETSRWFQSYFGYYFCTAALLCTVYHLYRARVYFWADMARIGKKTVLRVLIVASIGTYLMLLHEPTQMRVFNDEPSHALTAQAMAQERGVYSPNYAFYESGALVYAGPEPMYRLYFYPYIISLMHNLTGVRVTNAYIANAIIGFLILLAVFHLGWKVGGSRASGYLAQMLLLGMPLLHQVTNGGGYDLLNLLLFITFFIGCLDYLSRGGLRRLNLAIALGLLLAYCRSESILYLLGLAVVFLLRSLRDKQIRLSIFSILSPIFLLVPIAARKIGARLSAVLSEFYEHIETGFFSLRYVPDNSLKVLDWLFSTDSSTLNSLLISLLALASLLLLPILAFVSKIMQREKRSSAHRTADRVVLTFIALAGMHLLLIVSLYWDPTEASAIRFFLPIYLVLILLVVCGLRWMERCCQLRLHVPLIAVALGFIWLVTLPKASRAEVTRSSFPSAQANRSLKWAQANPDGRTLYAVKSSGHFILHGLPAISLRDLSSYFEAISLLVREGYYDRVLLIETRYFSPETNAWTQSYPIMPLRPDLVSERVAGWRGFLHGETEVRQVLGLRGEDGHIIPLGADSALPQEWPSNQEYYEFIRSLQMYRRSEP